MKSKRIFCSSYTNRKRILTMKWEPVFYFWAVLTVVELLVIQFTSKIQPSSRAGARGFALLFNGSFFLFVAIAAYFHFSIWWAVIVLPIIGMIVGFLFLITSAIKKSRLAGPGRDGICKSSNRCFIYLEIVMQRFLQ